MDYSLNTHNKRYQFSISDALYSTVTGFSGAVYASRHYELGHYAIAVIEYMPILGGIVALIERIAFAIFGASYSSIPWRKETRSTGDMNKTLLSNTVKAVREHEKKSPVYATLSEIQTSKSREKLEFTFEHSDELGPRPTMEDAKFIKETDQFVLAGVFDGHGGSGVSEFAAKEFEKRFQSNLKQCENPVEAFEKTFHEVQQDIASYSSFNSMGSTAVVTYIDKATNEVFTATLGDSEANLYRNIRGWLSSAMKSIPLSVVRDWTDQKERKRLEDAYGKEKVQSHFNRVRGQAKAIRSHLSYGVNVSRAFGDVTERGTYSQPIVIHKPKITKIQIKKGDTLVLACDGLKDYVKEEEIVEVVKGRPDKLAGELVKAALHSMQANAGDNITVIAIRA